MSYYRYSIIGVELYMKITRRKITASIDNGTYIGGKLFDMPESFWEDEEARIERTEEQDKYINNFAKNYVIYWNNGDTIEFTTDLDVFYDITDRMAIKEGVDVVAYKDHVSELVNISEEERTAFINDVVKAANATPTAQPIPYPQTIRSTVIPTDFHPFSESTMSFMERSVSSGDGKRSSLLPTSIDSSCQIRM